MVSLFIQYVFLHVGQIKNKLYLINLDATHQNALPLVIIGS